MIIISHYSVGAKISCNRLSRFIHYGQTCNKKETVKRHLPVSHEFVGNCQLSKHMVHLLPINWTERKGKILFNSDDYLYIVRCVYFY